MSASKYVLNFVTNIMQNLTSTGCGAVIEAVRSLGRSVIKGFWGPTDICVPFGILHCRFTVKLTIGCAKNNVLRYLRQKKLIWTYILSNLQLSCEFHFLLRSR